MQCRVLFRTNETSVGVRLGIDRCGDPCLGRIAARAGLASACREQLVRAVAGHLAQPRQKACRVAQARQPPPHSYEHFLGDILAGGDLADDRERDRGNESPVVVHELLVCGAITPCCGDDPRAEIDGLGLRGHQRPPWA